MENNENINKLEEITTNELVEECFWCQSKIKVELIEGIPFCQVCFEEQNSKMNEYKDSRTKFYPEIDKINDKIFLGNEDGQREIDILKELGVTHILVCAYGLKIFHPNDFAYLHLEMDDSPEETLDKFLVQGLKFIDNGEKVYVHCQAGISRSASIVIAYIMWKDRLPYNDAISLVREKRGCVCPNSGFELQLMKFEQILKQNNYLLE